MVDSPTGMWFDNHMSTTHLTDITGSHLTATDKRNINAVMAHGGFTLGETYKVNGRKSYSIEQAGEGRYVVTIRQAEVGDFGRFIRTDRTEFSAR